MNEPSDKEKIYTNYYPKVRSYIRNRIQNFHDTEDLVSQTFLKIYRNLENFDENRALLSTWIYSIAKNTVIDYFRTQNKVHPLEDNIPSEDIIDDKILSNELLDELAIALEKLDERERDIIILHYYHRKTLLVIAERMHISYSYIKVLHRKAISNLKELLN